MILLNNFLISISSIILRLVINHLDKKIGNEKVDEKCKSIREKRDCALINKDHMAITDFNRDIANRMHKKRRGRKPRASK